MTDQSNTGPDGVDAELAPDRLADADGTRSNEEVEEKAMDGGDSERQGPMVDDASIDWSTLDGGGAPAGMPTDPQPTDGPAPAP